LIINKNIPITKDKKSKKMQKKYKKAFSLVELSIVILITSILITGALGVSKTSKNNEKAKITKERMDIVYDAIATFVAQNRRLPCPASLELAKGHADYGLELGGDQSTIATACAGTFSINSAIVHQNPAYGMVPTQALGLDPEMAEDGFGTKFSYIVDRRFTRTSTGSEDAAVISFELIKSLPHEADAIGKDLVGIILTASGTPITPNNNAILVLISHGANKFKGWNASGTTQNIAAGTADENSNGCGSIDDPQTVPCNTTSVDNTYDRNFIASSTDANFDDIVLFKTKTQLVRDAGLEFIMCNGAEATINAGSPTTCTGTGTTQTWANNNYGVTAASSSNNGACFKTCGKYGIWGSMNSANPHLHVGNNTEQLLSNNVPNVLNFNTEIENRNYGSRPLSSQFKPNVAGYWLVSYNVIFKNAASNSRLAWIEKNSQPLRYAYTEVHVANSWNWVGLSGTSSIYFNGTTDYIKIIAAQASGGTLGSGNTADSTGNQVILDYLNP
jgi:prepilin-type N-terminal cleavage/methylation domain-containing protein